MKRHIWSLALNIAMLAALIFAAGCLTASLAPVVNSPDNSGDTSIDVPPEVPSSESEPAAITPPNNNTVSVDPVSGQSEEVDLRWEQLCLSNEYQVQIAKDPGFSIVVLDTGSFAPASSTSPGAFYPAGGRSSSPSSLTTIGNLEAGHTYYWRARVRQAATGQQMLSPWSEVSSFTVEPGIPTKTPGIGLQSIYPSNGLMSYPAKQADFSWSPLSDTTKYRFMLSKDAAITQVVVDTVTNTTAYTFEGQLDYGQAYFWRVMALEPVPGDWSATFSFRTGAAPVSPPSESPPGTPPWAWAIIVIGLILFCVIIVLIFTMRRR